MTSTWVSIETWGTERTISAISVAPLGDLSGKGERELRFVRMPNKKGKRTKGKKGNKAR